MIIPCSRCRLYPIMILLPRRVHPAFSRPTPHFSSALLSVPPIFWCFPVDGATGSVLVPPPAAPTVVYQHPPKPFPVAFSDGHFLRPGPTPIAIPDHCDFLRFLTSRDCCQRREATVDDLCPFRRKTTSTQRRSCDGGGFAIEQLHQTLR